MDIGNITNAYTDLLKTQSSRTASQIEQQAGKDLSGASDEELMDACKKFEAYFVEQMFKEMAKTIPDSDNTSSYASQITDYYKENMIQQISEAETEQGNLGLAKMLYEQMKRNYSL